MNLHFSNPKTRRNAAWAAVAAVLVTAVAVAVAGPGTSRCHRKHCGPPPTTTIPGPTTTLPPGILKPRLAGLVWPSASKIPAGLTGARSVYDNIAWSAIEPTQATFNLKPITDAVAAAHAGGFRFLLRIEAGVQAPDWAKKLNGFTPLAVKDPQGGGQGTVGPFWRADYEQVEAQMWAAVGAVSDASPELGKVTDCAGQTIFCENGHVDVTSVSALLADGFTDAAYQTTLEQSLTDMVASFPTTEVFFSDLNYQDNGTCNCSQTFLTTVVQWGRVRYGKQIATGWNGMRAGAPPTTAWQQYIASNPPADGQSATKARIVDAVAAAHLAATSYHYRSMEDSGQAYDSLTLAQQQTANDELAANA